MKKRFVIVSLFASLILSVGLFVSLETANSQNIQKRMTLSSIKKELISTEMTDDEKNKFLIATIKKIGVDFELSSDDEQGLRANGANDELIKAIKENSPKSVQKTTPIPTPISTPIPTPIPTPAETPVSIATPTPITIATPNVTETSIPKVNGKDPCYKDKSEPCTKETILEVLNRSNVNNTLEARITALTGFIVNQGIDFKLTDSIEQELKDSQATPKLIEIIRKASQKFASETLEKTVTNSIGMELVYIPSGSFKMGTDSLEKVKGKNGKMVTNSDLNRGYEDPSHTVTIKESFLMGKYEVTQEQWEKVMGLTIRKQRDKKNPDPNYNPKPDDELFGVGPKFPIYYVSWNDAQEFVKKLNAMDTQYEYRLPSEAEWEYACRAGTTGDYSGTGKLDEMGWYINNSGSSGKLLDAEAEWDKAGNNTQTFIENFLKPNKIEEAHPVGLKKPNKFGLYDMHGNVWEWCEDIFKDDYRGLPTDGSPNRDFYTTTEKVIRGGAWNGGIYPVEESLRSAYRTKSRPDYRGSNYGLRVVARVK